nr:hypothetical protein Iba_chr14aCG4680 [Ipomoea batatas]
MESPANRNNERLRPTTPLRRNLSPATASSNQGNRRLLRSSPFSGERRAVRQRPLVQVTELGREQQRRRLGGSGCGFATVAAGVAHRRQWRHLRRNSRLRHPLSFVAASGSGNGCLLLCVSGELVVAGGSDGLSFFSSPPRCFSIGDETSSKTTAEDQRAIIPTGEFQGVHDLRRHRWPPVPLFFATQQFLCFVLASSRKGMESPANRNNERLRPTTPLRRNLSPATASSDQGNRRLLRSFPSSGERRAVRQRPLVQVTELGRERQRRRLGGSGCGFATVAAGVAHRRQWRHLRRNSRLRHPLSFVAASGSGNGCFLLCVSGELVVAGGSDGLSSFSSPPRCFSIGDETSRKATAEDQRAIIPTGEFQGVHDLRRHRWPPVPLFFAT